MDDVGKPPACMQQEFWINILPRGMGKKTKIPSAMSREEYLQRITARLPPELRLVSWVSIKTTEAED